MTSANASTTAGSNCEPAFRRSSASAALRRQRLAVRAVARHRVEGVDDGDDARAERDLVERQAVGVAAAVGALVRRADDRADRLERRRRRDDALAHRAVALHEQPLGRVERAGLVEDRPSGSPPCRRRAARRRGASARPRCGARCMPAAVISASSATWPRCATSDRRRAPRAPAGARPWRRFRRARSPRRALVGVEALVGDVQRLLERDAREDARAAARAADRIARAALAERRPGRAASICSPLGVGRDDHELVAADPVGAAAIADDALRAGSPGARAAHRRRDGRTCRCSA